MFPPGQTWMLNGYGSNWSYIASAVENCKVQKNLSNNQVLIGNINWTLVKILFLLCIVCDTSHCNAMGHRHLLALSHESFSLQYMKMCFLQYEDWFLLRQMSKNVDSETFGDFLKSLNQEEDLDLGNNNNKPWVTFIKLIPSMNCLLSLMSSVDNPVSRVSVSFFAVGQVFGDMHFPFLIIQFFDFDLSTVGDLVFGALWRGSRLWGGNLAFTDWRTRSMMILDWIQIKILSFHNSGLDFIQCKILSVKLNQNWWFKWNPALHWLVLEHLLPHKEWIRNAWLKQGVCDLH